jgi:hypothetical protein
MGAATGISGMAILSFILVVCSFLDCVSVLSLAHDKKVKKTEAIIILKRECFIIHQIYKRINFD